jgi:hypothetical protein
MLGLLMVGVRIGWVGRGWERKFMDSWGLDLRWWKIVDLVN